MDKDFNELKKYLNHLLQKIENKIKAFEIINKKNVDIYWLKHSVDFVDYNLQNYNKAEQLTEKQYNLLKEVLHEQ